MDDRKYFILSAILRSYIESSQPIGSRTLKRDYEMDVSAATIRNDMSDLEHQGYLLKAHTSSGRIPSASAYRWFVDMLEESGIHETGMRALPRISLLHQSGDLEYMLENAVQILGDMTQLVSFYVIPGRGDDRLKKILLTPVSENEAVLLSVFESKLVQTQLVHLTKAYDATRIARTQDVLQGVLEGRSVRSMADVLEYPFFKQEYMQGNLISEIIPAFKHQIRDFAKPRIRYFGLSRFYQMEEYGGLEKATAFIDTLVGSAEIAEKLSFDIGGMDEVYIGAESGIGLFAESSVIASPFHIHGDFAGKIGVIGPMRMPYQHIIGDVRRMAKYVDSVAQRA